MVRRLDPLHKNNVHGLESFIWVWDNKIESDRYRRAVVDAPSTFRKSSVGNINDAGTSYSSFARMLTPHNEAFWRYVEPGVKALVQVLVDHHDLITYSSCEGHLYKDGSGDERHAGLAFRSADERARVVSAFERVADAANERFTSGVVEVAIRCDIALSEDGAKHPSVDFVFWKGAGGAWETYFMALPGIYAYAVELLLNEESLGDRCRAGASARGGTEDSACSALTGGGKS